MSARAPAGAAGGWAGGREPPLWLQFLFLQRRSDAIHAIFTFDDPFKNPALLLSPRKQRRRRERLGDPEAPRAQAALAAVSQAGKRCGCPASLPAPAATQASPAHRKGRRGACGLQVVSGSHVECPPRPHLCVPSVCRALQTTRGIGTSEPYLLFLKKALIAFCNCTVDKCPTSP